MNVLSVDFENCFGIGKLKHDFKFEENKSNTFLIYAPNGTMKTSFARTFDLLSKNEAKNLPCDRIYTTRVSKHEVLVDGSPISPESILVVNAEDNSFDASNKISSFIASKELKQQYDTIYKDLDERKGDYIKRLKTVSQSTDCESEFWSTFRLNNRESFFEILMRVAANLSDKPDKYRFKYNDVFDKKQNVKKFLDKNEPVLEQYVSDYKSLVSSSKLFKGDGENSFGTYQANELLKSIDDNSFFDAGHKFVLEDGTEINDAQTLKTIVQEEIDRIINDKKLKGAFEKVDKAIATNVELRSFRKVIDNNNLILVELKDYESFKKKVWMSYLSELKSESEDLVGYYLSKKAELEAIIVESKKEISLWKDIIETFNARFYVPFKVLLTNQDDIILKLETANLEFEYFDEREGAVRQKREDLLDVLSKGEQRAYFILQFLFEIESRKSSEDKNIIIFDDVADSFDYKNKFAIIEYIKDLHLSDVFRMIILTHNFDFYRTVFSRLDLKRSAVYMATKSNVKEIHFYNGQYKNDLFKHFIGRFREPKVFISLIAFVRNLIEYADSEECDDYRTLTSCLHQKENTLSLSANDIHEIFKLRLPKLASKPIEFGNNSFLDLIFQTAASICADPKIDEVALENKIALAIAIRLMSERYMISKLPEYDLSVKTSNQTSKLYQLYRKEFPFCPSLITLGKVNLMTPENIHINAFMYEPLIDMSVYHLRDLYQEVRELG